MTREERGMAIGFFKMRRKIFCEDYLKICPKNSNEYIATLIEKTLYDVAIEALEQEPCEDCISRQAVIDEIEYFQINPQHFDFVSLIDNIKDLPSVNPQDQKAESEE